MCGHDYIYMVYIIYTYMKEPRLESSKANVYNISEIVNVRYCTVFGGVT